MDSRLPKMAKDLAPYLARYFAVSAEQSPRTTTLTSVPAIEIQEEGTAVNTRSRVNFVSAALTAADDVTYDRINVTLLQSPVGSTSVVGTGRLLTAGTLIATLGDLSADRTVSVANGSSQYQIPVTGGSPFTPAYTDLSTFAGNGLAFTSGAFLVNVDGSSLAITSDTLGIKSTWAGQTAITTLGTITTGVWNGTVVGISYGGHGQATAGAGFDALAPTTTRGDLIYHNATTNARLAVSTAGKFVRSDGTDPGWSTLVLPNASTTGDILSATSANTIGSIAAVATGKALISAGTSTLPVWGALDISTAIVTGVLGSTNGGSGVSNAGTFTNASNTTITGGGTITLGGFTLTVPATGTPALLATANVFTNTNLFQPTADSATAILVKQAGGNVVFTVDTLNQRVGFNVNPPTSAFHMNPSINSSSSITERIFNIAGSLTTNARTLSNGVIDFSSLANYGTSGTNIWMRFSASMEPTANMSGTHVFMDEQNVLGSGAANAFNLTGTIIWHRLQAKIGAGMSGTVTNLMGFEFLDPSTGGATITNAAHVVMPDIDVGTTKNTNILIGTTTIPAGNWSMYNASAYDNYFATNIGIGVTSFNSALATLALKVGTAPASGTADTVFIYEADRGGAAGKGGIAFYAEDATPYMFSDRVGLFTLSPTIDMGMTGTAARTWGLERHSTANTAGNALTIQAAGATSAATDKAGGTLNLDPGISTGTGRSLVSIGGYVPATATGTGNATRVDRGFVGPFKALTNNTVTAIVNCTIASNTVAAVALWYAVEVFDGTNLQVEEGFVTLHATNKAGTIANNTAIKSGNQQAATSGTLAVTFTITAANPAVVSVNANSSLTPSAGYPKICYSIFNLTSQAIAIQ